HLGNTRAPLASIGLQGLRAICIFCAHIISPSSIRPLPCTKWSRYSIHSLQAYKRKSPLAQVLSYESISCLTSSALLLLHLIRSTHGEELHHDKTVTDS